MNIIMTYVWKSELSDESARVKDPLQAEEQLRRILEAEDHWQDGKKTPWRRNEKLLYLHSILMDVPEKNVSFHTKKPNFHIIMNVKA